jgi:glyoxylase-like metal-dependent hydrolase (beta-lactamase superfamily II)
MVNYKIFHFNMYAAACTLVWGDDKRCAIFDPGCQNEAEKAALTGFITREGLVPEAILLTHGHPDHICAVRYIQQLYGIPAYLSPADREMLPLFQMFGKIIKMDTDIAFTPTDATDGMEIRIGDTLRFKVIATPGHTPGGTCYYNEEGEILISGDTLFAGSIGRTDFKGSDYDALIRSILERLIPLPGDTLVIPGHGGNTTIGAERATNPFLEPFNEPLQEEDQGN